MSKEKPNREPPKPSKGIYITEGVDLTIHGLRLPLGSEAAEVSPVQVSLRQDLCRHWLKIAFSHSVAASSANSDLLAADRAGDGQSLYRPLEREFRASMQAVVASAIGLDSFYSGVKERIKIPSEHVDAWRKQRTARWKQMGEVFRLGFALKPQHVKEIRKDLKEVSKFRGWAVHPPSKQRTAVEHPDISRGVEWRFVAFRSENAIRITRAAIILVHRLVRRRPSDNSVLAKYCEGLKEALGELVAAWDDQFPQFPVT